MPRKKKLPEQMAPLDFVESPVHIPHKAPSPVFASDNPATADLITLDSETSLPWVSPQFRGLPVSPGKHRYGRRCRKLSGAPATRTRKKTGQNNTTVGGISLRATQHLNKFEALKFLGESKLLPQFLREDLVEEENLLANENLNVDIDTPDIATTNISTPNIENSGIRLQSPNSNGDQVGICEPMFNPANTPLTRLAKPSTAKKRGRKVKRKGRPLGLFDCESILENGHCNDVEEISGCDGNGGKQNAPQLDSNTKDTKLDTPNHNWSRLLDENCENDHPISCNPVTPQFYRRSPRLQAHGADIFSSLLNATQMASPTPFRVLVADTPEAEYGLSVRQRRLRKIGRHKQKAVHI